MKRLMLVSSHMWHKVFNFTVTISTHSLVCSLPRTPHVSHNAALHTALCDTGNVREAYWVTSWSRVFVVGHLSSRYVHRTNSVYLKKRI